MTDSSPLRTPPPGPPGGLLVEPPTSTGALRAAVGVTAVIVTRGGNPWFRRTLAAVRAQTRRPDRLVVVDVTASRAASGYGDLQLGDARLVPAPGARSFGEGVAAALADPVAAGARAPRPSAPRPSATSPSATSPSATSPSATSPVAGDPVPSEDAPAGPASGWLWLLHDDSVPAPDALARLLDAVEHSRTVAVAGPKQRRWPSGSADGAPRLVAVGVTTSRAGRRTAGFEASEIDQGQHDARDDVLAVGLAGALVRREAWDALDGTDPDLGPFGDGLELCRRARLAGHRVIVVPGAVVDHAQLALHGADPQDGTPPAVDHEPAFAACRRSEVRLRLTGCAPGWFLPLAVWLVVAAPFHAMYRLALKQPRHARDELFAPLLVLGRPASLARARARARRTATLPRRVLRPLEASWRDVHAERRWRRMAAAEERRAAYAPSELERAELAQLAVRRRAVAGAVAAALVVLTGVVFAGAVGPLLGGARLVGGSLLPATVSFGDLWHAATAGWVPAGYGLDGPADPVLAVLLGAAVLTGGHVQVAVGVLVVASVLVGGVGAWAAAGALTRWNAARAGAAAVWVAAPAALLALADGRLGPLVAHAALPWCALAAVRGLGVAQDDRVTPAVTGRPHTDRTGERGSLGALAAAALLLVPVVAGAPVLLGAAVVVVLATAVLAWRRALSLALVLAPSVVVLAPFWWYVTRTWDEPGLGWHLLLASPGPAVPFDAARPWELVLGWPQAATTPAVLHGTVATVAPYVLGGLVAAGALVAVVRSRRPRGVLLAWCAVAAGLAVALLAAGTPVATSTGGLVRGWPGPGTSLVLGGLLSAALLALPGQERLRTIYEPVARGPAFARGLAVVVALAVPVAALASFVHDDVRAGAGAGVGRLTVQADPVVPPVAQQMQDGGQRQRILALRPTADGTVDYAVLAHDGTQLTESSVVAEGRLLAGALPRAGAGSSADGPGALVAAAVGNLAGPGIAPATSTLARQLADLGVGGILLPPQAGKATATARSALVARLDTVPGLARVTEGQPSVLWRVAPSGSASAAPAWATLRDASGKQTAVVPSTTTGVRTTLAASPDERRLVLAESASDGWHARLGGRSLARVDDGWQQAFVVPAGAAGTLTIDYVSPHRAPWLLASGIVLLVVALLALPVRRRKVVLR